MIDQIVFYMHRYFDSLKKLKLLIVIIVQIALVIPAGANAQDLLYSNNFENSGEISRWYKVGSNAYKSLSCFQDFPGSGYPQNFMTLCYQLDIDSYHKMDIVSIKKNGYATKALYLSTLKADYPNRWTANVTPDQNNPFTEYTQEWNVRYSQSFIQRLGSSDYWNSQHAIWSDNASIIVLQLYGVNGQVFTRIILEEEEGVCSSNSNPENCGAGIDNKKISVLLGEKTGPSENKIYIADKEKRIQGDIWYNFKFYYKAGQGVGGEIKFLINDILIIHIKGDTAGTVARPSQINYVKLYGSTQSMPHEMWIDDFKLYQGSHTSNETANESLKPPTLYLIN